MIVNNQMCFSITRIFISNLLKKNNMARGGRGGMRGCALVCVGSRGCVWVCVGARTRVFIRRKTVESRRNGRNKHRQKAGKVKK